MNLDTESFRDVLEKGQGRAILHLRTCDQAIRASYQPLVLAALATDQRYDRQTEAFRGPYLWDVLQATHEPQWYALYLEAILSNPSAHQAQAAYLCGALTSYHLAELREPLYAACKRDLLGGSTDIAEQLLPWDGATAWRFVLEHTPVSVEHWQRWYLFETLGETSGKRAARHAGDDSPALRLGMGTLLRQERLDRQERRLHWRNKQQPPSPTYERMMESLQRRLPFPSGWQNDLALLQRLAATPPSETEALRRWLLLFRSQPFPLHPAPLLALTYHDDATIAWRALHALGLVTDPCVRRRALELWEARSPLCGIIPELLAKCPHPSDIPHFDALLTHCSDDTALHHFGLSLFRYIEQNPTAPLISLLLRLFEKTPCSDCRHTVALHLQKRNALPPEKVEECRWDCNPDTRALVA